MINGWLKKMLLTPYMYVQQAAGKVLKTDLGWQGPTSPERLRTLSVLIEDHLHFRGWQAFRGLRILEIGALNGESARMFSGYGFVTSVDLFCAGSRRYERKMRGSQHVTIKGDSRTVLPMLRQDYFDVVYVDGCHTYPTVHSDIYWAANLVKPGGLLCGDDCERQLKSEEEYRLVCKLSELDYVDGYHPGVSCAVWALQQDTGWDIGAVNGVWYCRRPE